MEMATYLFSGNGLDGNTDALNRGVWSPSFDFGDTGTRGFGGWFSSSESFSTTYSPFADNHGVLDADYLSQAPLPPPPSSTEVTQPQGALKHSASDAEGLFTISSRPPARTPNPERKSKPTLCTRKTKLPPEPSSSGLPVTDDDDNLQVAAVHKRTRQSNQNEAEKQYRGRLNLQFELLLAALHETGGWRADEDRRVSKAEVLDSALRHIHVLEAENKELQTKQKTLLENLEFMRRTSLDITHGA